MISSDTSALSGILQEGLEAGVAPALSAWVAIDGEQRAVALGAWDVASAGGCLNYMPTWRSNPQYRLTVKERCTVLIAVQQQDEAVARVLLRAGTDPTNAFRLDDRLDDGAIQDGQTSMKALEEAMTIPPREIGIVP